MRSLVLAVLVTVLAPAVARASSMSGSTGVGPGLGVRFSNAPLGLRRGSWLEARVAEMSFVETRPIASRSLYLNPLRLSLGESVAVVPGSLALRGRFDLTASLWQSTGSIDASGPPPLLACGSGSIAQASVGFSLPHELTIDFVLGAQDDPAHLDDGAECLGGGPVWQSNRWIGARAEARLDSIFSVGLGVGSAAHDRHTVVARHEHGEGGHHEHVAERRVQGLEAGAWLSAAP